MQEGFGALEIDALADFSGDDMPLDREQLLFTYQVDLRYVGQEHTVKVVCSGMELGKPDIEATSKAFHAAHEKRFTYRLDNAIELVNFHLVAKVAVPKPPLAPKTTTGRTLETAIIGSRPSGLR